jgi:uncharacterized membrane protein YgaE (UPF0421/DUF939 family)
MIYSVVKRDFSFKNIVPILLILLLTVALAALATMWFFYLPLLVLILGLIVAIYLSPRFLKNEYEYSIEGDVFSVALIMNKKSRKELFSADIEKLIAAAPLDEAALGKTKKIDVRSSENPFYSAIFSSDTGCVAVIFSPGEEFIKQMRLLAPSKVKLSQ